MTDKPENPPAFPKRRSRPVAFIDSFENATLTPKQHGNAEAVLAALKGDPKVSSFEMTVKLWDTLKNLEASGKIKSVPSGYPWHRYELLSERSKNDGK